MTAIRYFLKRAESNFVKDIIAPHTFILLLLEEYSTNTSLLPINYALFFGQVPLNYVLCFIMIIILLKYLYCQISKKDSCLIFMPNFMN